MSFGVFVTTAFIAPQAYQEVREDEHPVVFLAGREIATLLKRMGLTEPRALSDYLTLKFRFMRWPFRRSTCRCRR